MIEAEIEPDACPPSLLKIILFILYFGPDADPDGIPLGTVCV